MCYPLNNRYPKICSKKIMKPSSCKTGETNWQEICGFYTHSECMLLLKTQLLFFYLHLSTHSFFLLLIWIWVTWAQMPRPPSFCNVSKPPVRCNLSFMSWVFFGASLWWDMPEISHLIRCPNLNLPPLDVEEWRLYFESLAISKAELRHRLDGVHFWCLYLQSYSFGQFSQT